MEVGDIEDVVAGLGAPPGLRLPINAVAVKPKRRSRADRVRGELLTNPLVPGTQVRDAKFNFSSLID